MIRHRYGWMRWSGVLIALVLLAILGTALGFACAVWWAS